MVHRESCDLTISGEQPEGEPDHYHLHLTWKPKHGMSDAETGDHAGKLRKLMERWHDKLNNMDGEHED
jgi:hypothetical protein